MLLISTHQFRSTKTQRTIESAREFFEGAFPNYEFDLPAPILNDTVLRVKYGKDILKPSKQIYSSILYRNLNHFDAENWQIAFHRSFFHKSFVFIVAAGFVFLSYSLAVTSSFYSILYVLWKFEWSCDNICIPAFYEYNEKIIGSSKHDRTLFNVSFFCYYKFLCLFLLENCKKNLTE